VVKDLKSSDPSGAYLRTALLKAKAQYEASSLARPGGSASNRKIKVIIDVDPQGMM
jgi:hypothetical protein